MKKLFIAIFILITFICSSASSYDSSGLSSSLKDDAKRIFDFFHGSGDINEASSSYDRLYELFYEDPDTFILNTHKGKYHYPDCSGVGQMNPENKTEVYCSRNLLESMGFDACGTCHPDKSRKTP